VDEVNLASEPLRTHTDLRGEALAARVMELLERVGLEREHLYRYPHEFSGGQCQRIAMVRVLAMKRRLRSPKCVGSEFPC
jgi:ABC-type oligopeptide transport system ATPase subunit